jgi:poly-gamma-glutamate capsule biosynthesis protein CapA/YwtB (metallophosphatase superfamily)
VDARKPKAVAATVALFAVVLVCVGVGSAARGHDRSAGAGVAQAETTKRATSPVRLTVEVNGDILVHGPVWQRALQDGHGTCDFAPMLRELRPYVRAADLAICHVETPMSPSPPQGYPVFNTPTQLARAIRQTGWRICDTASNHSVDHGQYGIDQTALALDRAGVLHTGSFPSSAAQNRTLIVTVKGVKVAFLAYTEMTNGLPLPHPWSVNVANVAALRRAARIARRRGAQVVIVNFHWAQSFRHSQALSSWTPHASNQPSRGALGPAPRLIRSHHCGRWSNPQALRTAARPPTLARIVSAVPRRDARPVSPAGDAGAA